MCLQCRRPGFDPWVGKTPWRRERLPTPVFWPGEFHGLYSPWDCKEDMTEQLSLSLSLAGDSRDMVAVPGLERSPGEGNGNPLQYSCLENPMDKGVWWATVHGGHRKTGLTAYVHAFTYTHTHTHTDTHTYNFWTLANLTSRRLRS